MPGVSTPEHRTRRDLDRMLQGGTPALIGADGEKVELPHAVYRLLKDIVRNMQLGRAIVLIPENQQLTTQRAADFLGVSRPHLIKLVESGELDRTGIPEGGEDE